MRSSRGMRDGKAGVSWGQGSSGPNIEGFRCRLIRGLEAGAPATGTGCGRDRGAIRALGRGLAVGVSETEVAVVFDEKLEVDRSLSVEVAEDEDLRETLLLLAP